MPTASFVLHWAGSLVVRIPPRHGGDREFKSLPAHFFLFYNQIEENNKDDWKSFSINAQAVSIVIFPSTLYCILFPSTII
jgi:hypothetical protein